MGQQDDAELVATALAGGPEAFNAIVERYRGQVYGVALARLGNFDAAEDIAQQVLIEAYAGLHTLRDPRRLGPWLRATAIHRSIDMLRQQREHLEIDEAAGELTTDLTPEVELERNQLREQVLTAIGRLSKAQRETTTLYYMGGHSVEAVATMQEVPVGTVKRRLHDARNRLKTEMLKMVEETLKDEAPKEDFSQQVYEALTLYYRKPASWPWREAVTEADDRAAEEQWENSVGKVLMAYKSDDMKPFERGLQHQQSLTRYHTLGSLQVIYLDYSPSPLQKKAILGLIKGALQDPNKRVRSKAVRLLCSRLGLDEDYICKEVLPLVIPMLRDEVAYVRHKVAKELCSWPAHVPLEEAAGALAAYPDGKDHQLMRRLVNLIIEARGKPNL
ncbi:MAG: sigma-70 family RNA polymerase sigma factor [Candidatus Latescibacteria bacterium]|nr:sigma-70 family RNA polymerase sigma factor [Candidatus Latescibacterota bacterium]